MSNKPYFVISLDFELYWGMFDKVSLEEYGKNIAGVHELIPKLLGLFNENGIHVTWATVGMLAAKNKSELVSWLPEKSLQPIYPDQKVSAYYHLENFSVGDSGSEDKYHYGRHLIEKIIATPNQELASHTFSHYYCIDGDKNNTAIFAADCQAFKKAMSEFNTNIKSIVFPRNQTTEEALIVCKEEGLTAYRGTPNHWLYSAKNDAQQSNPLLRIWRLKDAYLNLSGHHTFNIATTKEGALVNVRGSRFLRPFNPNLKFLESLKLRRIKNSMTYAAKNGEVFHLWWHPHNFGINQTENLAQLQEIIGHYHFLKQTYAMQSINMQEVTHLAKTSPL